MQKTPMTEKVREYLKKNGKTATSKEIAAKMKTTKKKVSAAIDTLRRGGVKISSNVEVVTTYKLSGA